MKEKFNIRYALKHIFTSNSLSPAYAHSRPSLCRRAVSDALSHQESGSRTGVLPPDSSPLHPLTHTHHRVIAPPTLALELGSGPGPTACGRRRFA